MFKIVKKSTGGCKLDFMTGFSTEEEACEIAESFDWEFIDGNGFCWELVVEEVI